MPLKSAHEIDAALEQWQRKSEITLSVASLLVAAAELAQTLPVEERVMLADCMRDTADDLEHHPATARA